MMLEHRQAESEGGQAYSQAFSTHQSRRRGKKNFIALLTSWLGRFSGAVFVSPLAIVVRMSYFLGLILLLPLSFAADADPTTIIPVTSGFSPDNKLGIATVPESEKETVASATTSYVSPYPWGGAGYSPCRTEVAKGEFSSDKTEYRCTGGWCIDAAKFCDGFYNCGSEDDEFPGCLPVFTEPGVRVGVSSLSTAAPAEKETTPELCPNNPLEQFDLAAKDLRMSFTVRIGLRLSPFSATECAELCVAAGAQCVAFQSRFTGSMCELLEVPSWTPLTTASDGDWFIYDRTRPCLSGVTAPPASTMAGPVQQETDTTVGAWQTDNFELCFEVSWGDPENPE